jgi:hypothetical protein
MATSKNTNNIQEISINKDGEILKVMACSEHVFAISVSLDKAAQILNTITLDYGVGFCQACGRDHS